MLKDTAIFVDECSLFAAPHLARALGVTLYTMIPKYNNFFGFNSHAVDWDSGRAIKEQSLIIIGYNAMRAIEQQIKRFTKIAIILSDSWSCAKNEYIDKFIEAYKPVAFAMPDIQKFFKNRTIPIYQTIDVSHIPIKKPERLTITHSPSNGVKYAVKGSDEIIRVINKLKLYYDFDFRLIQNLSMTDCLKQKAQSHIFIDQLIYKNPKVPQSRFGSKILYDGGLGKSGIEAMLLDNVVITGGMRPETEEYFPSPPVLWTDFKRFENDLKQLISNSEQRDSLQWMQRKWVGKYASASFIKDYIAKYL